MKALIFEEHSSVLPHWWAQRARARTLVYFDAHLDLQYVGPGRIGRLEQCASVAQVAALEKPHDLHPDAGYSYSLENFLYPAARLGLIGRLVWVAPPHVRAGHAALAIRELQKMDGVAMEDLLSFRRVDGRIEGRLMGLEVVMCGLEQLRELALPADSLLDLDADYFVEVPGDRPWTDPREVIDVLHALPARTDCLTISRSVSSGFMPLRLRFYADYLAALWERRQDEADHYARLYALDLRLGAGEREAVARALQAEAARWPSCAATWHLLALAQAGAAEAADSHARAVAISPAYAPSVLRAACEIRNRRLAADLAQVMQLGRQLRDLAGTERALASAAVGLLCCRFGDVSSARACYRQAASALATQGELALEIAELLLRAERPDEAGEFLAAALESDKSRSAALSFLGHLCARGGRLPEARRHLEEAHRSAPCWREPLALLERVYRQAGNDRLAGECAARIAVLREQEGTLQRQLAPAA
ncbi:MAG TPA: hypothetical protein VFV84_16270 [Burkholderiales bacterium]|nr:hypothetical protein [Burkholderiales bacterium]